MRTYKTVKASQQARLREALAINFIPKGYVQITGVGDVAQEVAPKITPLLAKFRAELDKAIKEGGADFTRQMFLYELRRNPHSSPLLYLLGLGFSFSECFHRPEIRDGLQAAEDSFYRAALAS